MGVTFQDVDLIGETLDITDELASQPTKLARLQQYAEIATHTIQLYCHREFIETMGVKFFNAPYNTLLSVPDLKTITTIAVGGNPPLVENTDYRLVPNVASPGSTTLLQRLVGGNRISYWQYQLDPDLPPYGVVEIDGTWGYGGGIPSELPLACEMITIDLWQRWKRQFATDAGYPITDREVATASTRLVTAQIKDLLQAFILPDEEQIITAVEDIDFASTNAV